MLRTRINHYEIVEKLGEGGSGTVYKAFDRRLSRFVALKFLSREHNYNEKKIKQFKKEARIAASLNHPNICLVYDIGESQDTHYIVMEYIDGKTLREILDIKGYLSSKEALRIVIKVATALEVTHSQKIIHRDIKPENIMLTQDGQIKVTDFGLAKLRNNFVSLVREPSEYSSMSDNNLSMSGIQGTASYMSPEQINRDEIDERTDIFSLGIVLYEILTGVHPFSGDNVIAVLHAIQNKTPQAPSKIRKKIPRDFNSLILRSLAKQSLERPDNIEEMIQSLTKIKNKNYVRNKISKKIILFLLIFLTGVFSYSLYHIFFSTKSQNIQVSSTGYTKWGFYGVHFAPDGESYFYLDKGIGVTASIPFIWQRYFNGRPARKFPHTVGEIPDLSPDGSTFVYHAGGKGLVIADLKCAEYTNITEFGNTPQWSPDGKQIVFSTSYHSDIGPKKEIFIYHVNEKILQKISPDTSLNFVFPDWSPDGKWIICTGGIGSQTEIWLINLIDRKAFPVTNDNAWIKRPVFSPCGKYIYFISNVNKIFDIWYYNLSKLENKLIENKVQLTYGNHVGYLDISPDGSSILFTQDRSNEQVWRVRLNKSKQIRLLNSELILSNLQSTRDIELSPDGDKLIMTAFRGGVQILLHKHLIDGSEKILHQQSAPFAPSWAADGKWIAFDAGGGNNADIYRVSTNGDRIEKIIEHPGADWMPTYSPNGKYLCFLSNRSGQFDIWCKDLSSQQITQITKTSGTESRGFWSHNSQQIAYFNNFSSIDTVEICIFDFNSKAHHKIVQFGDGDISILRKLIWSDDDSVLYYLSASGKKMIEISIKEKICKPVVELYPKEALRFTFEKFKNSAFFVTSEQKEDIWLITGLPQ